MEGRKKILPWFRKFKFKVTLDFSLDKSGTGTGTGTGTEKTYSPKISVTELRKTCLSLFI